jgi:hypothetical protein
MAITIEQGEVSQVYKRLKLDAVSAVINNVSSAVDTCAYIHGEVQVVHANHNNESVWQLEVSLDGGINYDAIANSDNTTSAAGGSCSVRFDRYLPGGMMRVKVVQGDTNADATLTPYIILKGRVQS